MLRQFLSDIARIVRDRDALEGLRRALETLERSVDNLHRQIDLRDTQIAKLRAEYAALESHIQQMRTEAAQTERQVLFVRLQSVMTQLPTLRAAVAKGADIPVQDVLDVVAPLDEMLEDMGYKAIGKAGGESAYDPARHHVVGRGARSVTPGDPVRVRYVGYINKSGVVCKAEVTPISPP